MKESVLINGTVQQLSSATVGLGGLMASNCEAHLDALSVLLKYKELIKASSSNSMIKFNENIN